MKRHIRNYAAATVLLVALAAGLYTQRVRISDFWQETSKPELPEAVTYEEVKGTKEANVPSPIVPLLPEPVELNAETVPPAVPKTDQPRAEKASEDSQLPVAFNLAVPFTSQAPFANWDEVHEETCEEASVYMVHLFYQGEPEGLVDPQTAEDEIQRIVAFEMSLFGFFKDTSADQTAIFAEQLYGYTKTELLHDPTVEDIKRHVYAGHPVIIPAAGRQLGNPYFTPPGPIYHMLVVRGWTQNGFIVNDPGTRRGEGYFYTFGAVMNAMHDWNGGDVGNGAKVAVVIYPEP